MSQILSTDVARTRERESAGAAPHPVRPHDAATDDRLRRALGCAVLAPSSHNTQPWRFAIEDGGGLAVYADRRRALRVVDPQDRELTISCGAALFHLRLALRHEGLGEDVVLLPERDQPDLLARVVLGGRSDPTAEDGLLFGQIARRHTNRQRFEARPLPPTLLEALPQAAAAEGAWLRVIQDGKKKEQIATLVAEGDRVQLTDPAFRRELAAWLRPNRGGRLDGLPGYTQGFGDLMALAAPLVVRTFDLGQRQAARDRELTLGAPVLAVLGTAGDTPTDWLHTGQALARLLLRARASDVWASFLNQPIEVAALRPRLGDVAGGAGVPQILLRLGYGPAPRPAPRRPLDDVLM